MLDDDRWGIEYGFLRAADKEQESDDRGGKVETYHGRRVYQRHGEWMEMTYTSTMGSPSSFSYESMGTSWKITIWDVLEDGELAELQGEITFQSAAFSSLYSRFDSSSLVWSLSRKRGVVDVPEDLITMLRIYERLEPFSQGKFTPCIGFTLSDLGYDSEYSLKEKEHIRPVPKFSETLNIIDDTHLELCDAVLLDLGAVGKGFFVDKIAAFLRSRGYKRFLVDGSGDTLYEGDGQPIRCGLEDPSDAAKAIGVLTMTGGAFCSSGNNRRRWSGHHHILDPHSLRSPEHIVATWVQAPTAAMADALATCIFLAEPENFSSTPFEYCILNQEYKVKKSAGFSAELFRG